MAVSSFDPNVFLAQEVKGANEIKFTPIPKGEYKAFIDDIDMDEYEGSPILVINYAIMDDTLKATLGLEKPTQQDRIFLDMENGQLAFGVNKNVRLGRTREAVGQNNGKAWQFNQLRGAGPVKLLIDHKPGKNAGEVFSYVARVAKAS